LTARTGGHIFELKEPATFTRARQSHDAVLEERLASLEGAVGAVATSSGMGWQFRLPDVLTPGDHIVASAHLTAAR
jgi:O-acetylhomoserine (thiol)-lyase